MPARGQCQRAIEARLKELGIDPDKNWQAADALAAAKHVDTADSGSGYKAASNQLRLIMWSLDEKAPPPTLERVKADKKSEPATEVDPVDELRSRVAKLRTDTG